ncbi:hypothetical protein TNCV_27911 [Trichonephila clavipes]|uniref:Mos1 transposase HTH domain-containing protein n=1 Tax=Trichonephila clavipes TaxID=2585209 RepID=A0A8X7BLM9_TRICX|nr:hypothetical protein TNCV_27911 [Trichonephila clavipes]
MEATGNLCNLFGEEAVTAGTCQRNWLGKFHLGDFSLKDEPRSGRPPTSSLGFNLVIHQTTALDYIKKLFFMSELTVWAPHKVSEKN